MLMEKMNEEQKCQRKRKVRSCYMCCRFAECNGDKPKNFENVSVEPLVGAIIYSALFDLTRKIPPLKDCKTRDQKTRRKMLIYYQASARNFFNSELFKLTSLDFEYLRRAYEKTQIQDE